MSQVAESWSLAGHESSLNRPAGAHSGERARLLLIDDDPAVWRAVRMGLTRTAFALQ